MSSPCFVISTLCLSNFAIILMGKRGLVALLKQFSICGSSSWCHGLVCDVLLWYMYFLIILTCFFTSLKSLDYITNFDNVCYIAFIYYLYVHVSP